MHDLFLKLGYLDWPELLPGDSPRVDAAARRRDVQTRKEHLAWRFRS